MSLAELKDAAAKLGARQRKELRTYLSALDRQRDAVWRSEMNARLTRLKSGGGVTQPRRRQPARAPERS